MTTTGPGDPQAPAPDGQDKVPPETLELRAQPRPVTRINRKVLIGTAAVVLLLIAGLVLLALRAPSLRVAAPQELFNVEHKPIADALSKLPASYDGVPPDKKPAAAKATGSGLPKGIPAADPANWDDEAERAEKALLARMEAEARKSPVFFRLALKAPPKETVSAEARPDGLPPPAPTATDGSLAALSALRANERAVALAGGDLDALGAGTTDQTRKLTFLKSGPEKDIYNPHALQTPASPYQLMAGTVIAASLITGLNSDLPGFAIAQVTENVFDTVSGRHLLIPQGSRLVGKYDNIVAFGQERALVVWQRIILPDGSSVVIDNLPATDTGGYAGLADQVDFHTWKLLKGVALATVLGVGSELAFGSSDSDLVKALQQSTQATTNRAGQRLIERQLNVQPTITVRPGWPVRVIVHKDVRAPALPRTGLPLNHRKGPAHARHRNVLCRQGRLCRQHPHAHAERPREDHRQRPQGQRGGTGLPHLARDDRDRCRLAQDQAGHRPDLPACAPRRPGLASAGLGRTPRKQRGRHRAPDLASRQPQRGLSTMRGNGLDSTPPGRARHTGAVNGTAVLNGHPSHWLPASLRRPPVERSSTTKAISPVRVRPARPAAVRDRLLPLLPLPLHQRADLRGTGLRVRAVAADLGFLTATYFLAFGLIQLPLGVGLDRYGPRRVQAVLLVIAAAGAALFATADGFPALAIGRGLIGLGVAGALMAGLKAIVLWFPSHRIALANGWFIMLGALGAVTATAPAEIVLARIGWRGLFAVLAAVTAASAVVILLVVPERRQSGVRDRTLRRGPASPRSTATRASGGSRRCRRSASGPPWSLQGLWAAPWLADVEGLQRRRRS